MLGGGEHICNHISTASVVLWLACSPRVRKIVGLSTDLCKPKTLRLVFVASPLSIIKENEQRQVARIQDNVSEWGHMSTRGLLFQ